MQGLLRRRSAAAVLLLTMITSFFSVVDVAWANSAPVPTYAGQTGWTLYQTFPTYAACVTAGKTNPGGFQWKCVGSATQPNGFDLYFWT